MKTYLFLVFAAALMLTGCSKKQQALEEMQQPMSPEDLTRITTQTTESVNATIAQTAPEATIVSTSGEKLEPLPPSGPYKPANKEIQLALKNAGYYTGAIDGKLGPKSSRAIEEFQKANGLVADGKVGPKTWAALSRYLTAVPAAVAATEAAKQ